MSEDRTPEPAPETTSPPPDTEINSRRARSRSRSWDRERDRIKRLGRSFTNSSDPYLKRARLFIGDLNTKSGELRKRDLEHLFGKYGRVSGISVHNGYAFVQMDRERSANKAIHFAHGKTVNGHKIRVEFSSAALQAGAKFRPLSPGEREEVEGSMRHHSSDLYSYHRDPLALLEIERMERERLERLLLLEREMHACDDPYESSSRRSGGYSGGYSHSSGDSWRGSDYGRSRRDYSPPTYGSRRSPVHDSSSYYSVRSSTPPTRYGDSSTGVGYHGVDKSASRDSYSPYGNSNVGGYGGRSITPGRNQAGPNIGYGRDSVRGGTGSSWSDVINSPSTYGLMGSIPSGWK